jgi:hypothetical protein
MREKIGEEAGRIWQILGAKDEIDMTTLPKMLKGKGEVVYQALGWLAHEDKITYRMKAEKTFVSLNDREKEAYLSNNQMHAISDKPMGEKPVTENRATSKQAAFKSR